MANVNFKMNDDLKSDFETACERMGLNVSTVLNLCAREIVKEQGIPFKISCKPNAETIAAMEEADKISRDANAKKFNNVDELRSYLGV